MRDALVVSALSLLPRNRLAGCMGWLARTRASAWATRAFVAAYGVDLTEAEHPPAAYPTLSALFTRRLRPGARPIDPAPDALVSPVDGAVAFVGTTREGRFDVAPGRPLTLEALLGGPVAGERDVAVLYLSPRDYHRVHVPREGRAVSWRYVPGTLWPVFPGAVRRVPGLFARNERLCVHLDTDAGAHDVVLVGAFGVGRIEVVLTDLLSNTGAGARDGVVSPPRAMGRGEELGTFHLGSTVVVCAPAGRWRWTAAPGEAVRMGQRIATSVIDPHARTTRTPSGH